MYAGLIIRWYILRHNNPLYPGWRVQLVCWIYRDEALNLYLFKRLTEVCKNTGGHLIYIKRNLLRHGQHVIC